MIEKLKMLEILDECYVTTILNKIYNDSNIIYNKNDIVEIKVIGLSNKNFTIELSVSELYLPIFSYIFKIIDEDIKLNFVNNHESLKYNYYKSINLYINNTTNEKLSIFHILIKHNFNYSKDTLIIYFNDIGLTHNYDKELLYPTCPITLEKITIPYVCKKCNNSFEKTRHLLTVKQCPMCRYKKFSSNLKSEYLKGFENIVKNTIDIYFYDYMTLSELLNILYKLELWFYNQGDENIISKKTMKNIEIDFNNRTIGLKRDEVITKINKKLNNIYFSDSSFLDYLEQYNYFNES